MSSQQFSLAVVKGASAGTSILSARPRISVGSADDNDLILSDPGVAPRHFSVLIDGERWRVSSQSGTPSVNVDRGWLHPENGRRGAVIEVASAQLILYPGHLDKQTIELEVSRRQYELDPDALPTALNLPRVTLKDEDQPGSTVPMVPAHVDQETIAQMETIAAARPPDDLRAAAQERLQEERRPSALSGHEETLLGLDEATGARPQSEFDASEAGTNADSDSATQIANDPSRKSAWEKAKGPTRADSSLPEARAEPESQVMQIPEQATRPRPLNPELAGPPPPIDDEEDDELDRATMPQKPSRRNAWGDAKAPPKNAWGDPESRALVPTRDRRGNRWGDPSRRDVAPAADPWKVRTGAVRTNQDIAERRNRGRDRNRREGLHGVRHKLSIDVLRRRNDPGLNTLRNPDGPLATSVRLLGARVEEFKKSLGHRAYMFTSPESLTGKTTAALNLALALAEDTNRRVAIVEANFRHPRFAQILGIDERLGLLSTIDGRTRLGDSAVKIADRNLLLLPSGGVHRHPAEILASPRFKTLMSELVEAVDVALIDAPSVQPYADTNLLLPLVDAVFLVVSQTITSRARMSEALNQLGKKRVLGSLFNHIPREDHKLLRLERRARMSS